MTLLALTDADTQQVVRIVLLVGFVILSLSIHEWAHAYTAHKLGDDTAKSMGRLTWNPIVHIDPVMTIAVPAILLIMSNGTFVFGGAKPVPVDPRNFKNPYAANALVAAAGPISNLVQAFVFAIVWYLSIRVWGYQQHELLPAVLKLTAYLNVILAVFNMIPIPPLDGSRIVMWLLPQGMRPGFAGLERIGIFIVLALIYMTPLGPEVFRTMLSLNAQLFSLVGELMGLLGL
ncbi:Peptidase family M50 [Planctomycetes bacterium Pla163]|uniref:Peptidase family M50 n=1 Tax=Rohdeia mirabilis TaxID=2528008 RepID=A0A518CUM0_9BACT|nr:Peptidase family M50 [Planctomycetes bacterium Pla163]